MAKSRLLGVVWEGIHPKEGYNKMNPSTSFHLVKWEDGFIKKSIENGYPVVCLGRGDADFRKRLFKLGIFRYWDLEKLPIDFFPIKGSESLVFKTRPLLFTSNYNYYILLHSLFQYFGVEILHFKDWEIFYFNSKQRENTFLIADVDDISKLNLDLKFVFHNNFKNKILHGLSDMKNPHLSLLEFFPRIYSYLDYFQSILYSMSTFYPRQKPKSFLKTVEVFDWKKGNHENLLQAPVDWREISSQAPILGDSHGFAEELYGWIREDQLIQS
jgi:hypothetical protein